METIRILSLPEIAFAHEYGNTIYRNDLPAKTNCIEVTYIAEGTLTLSRENTESTARRNDVLCNLSRAPLRVTGDSPPQAPYRLLFRRVRGRGKGRKRSALPASCHRGGEDGQDPRADRRDYPHIYALRREQVHSVGAVFADFGRDPRLRGAGRTRRRLRQSALCGARERVRVRKFV